LKTSNLFRIAEAASSQMSNVISHKGIPFIVNENDPPSLGVMVELDTILTFDLEVICQFFFLFFG
jgi:hypothetical protein